MYYLGRGRGKGGTSLLQRESTFPALPSYVPHLAIQDPNVDANIHTAYVTAIRSPY